GMTTLSFDTPILYTIGCFTTQVRPSANGLKSTGSTGTWAAPSDGSKAANSANVTSVLFTQRVMRLGGSARRGCTFILSRELNQITSRRTASSTLSEWRILEGRSPRT